MTPAQERWTTVGGIVFLLLLWIAALYVAGNGQLPQLPQLS